MEATAKKENEIMIQQALEHIRSDNEPFSLGFVTITGEKRFRERLRLGGRSVIQRQREVYTEPKRKGREIKNASRLLLYDLEAEHPIYIQISLITHFQGMRVVHTYAKGKR